MILLFLSAYLVGSIPTAYLYCRLRGKDIRKEGSGNVGATNAARLFGKSAFITVFAIDSLKGYIAVRYLVPLFAPVNIGHVWTIFLRFKGGKGVAVSAGGLLALMPQTVFYCLGVFGIIFLFFRIVSLGSICAAVSLPFIAWLRKESGLYIGFSLLLALFIIFTHRSNLLRLFTGKELKVGIKKEDNHPEPVS